MYTKFNVTVKLYYQKPDFIKYFYFLKYSRTSLIRTPGDHQNPFVLTGVICIENALKGTEIVFVLTGNSY